MPRKGFVTNYQVKPFKRDEHGRVIYAIHGDYKVRPQNKHLLEEYPRRSVELWWSKRELDPIAMLGGSSPERDLGVVIRHGRINHVSLAHTPRTTSRSNGNGTSSDEVVRFTTRGNHTIESYSIETPLRRSRATQGASMNGNGRGGYPSRNGRGTPNRRYGADCGPDGMPNRYEDGDMDTDDMHDAGDDGVPNEGDGMDSAESDPVLAKLFQSKQWKERAVGWTTAWVNPVVVAVWATRCPHRTRVPRRCPVTVTHPRPDPVVVAAWNPKRTNAGCTVRHRYR